MTSSHVMLSQLSHPDFTNVGTKTPMAFNACSAEVSSTLHLDTNNIANYTTKPLSNHAYTAWGKSSKDTSPSSGR